MAEILEITFERVQIENVTDLIIELLSGSTLRDCQVATDTPHIEINLESPALFQDSVTQSSDGTFYFNFLNFHLKDLHLSWAGFQIYKYNNIYDLNLDFELDEVTQRISVSDLHGWSKLLAKELEAKTFFGGYEPAFDADTRFFSEDGIGPLKAW